ncbi:MAG: Rha family transcriptional regulator [Eikenella sp.]|nr:Rha family transcriptional regulator [Eikenella sp.]
MTSQPLVRHSGDRLITTSLDISNHFNKKHAHVLRDIENIECSQKFRESNFGLSSYTTSQNKQMPMYEITRDGFVFLCMGFTGHAAAVWKEKYIAAFNAMEAELHGVQAVDTALLQKYKAAFIQAAPLEARLIAYYEKGLTLSEIGKLLDLAPGSVAHRLKKLAGLQLVAYTPDPVLSARGKRGRAQMLAKRAQQALPLED